MQDYTEIFNSRGHLYNEAISRCPTAREAECAALLDLLNLKDARRVADSPAGGGYVAEGIRARNIDLEIVCVEPARRFAAAIDPDFFVVNAPLDATGLADASLDAIASLAGLHHFADKAPVYREWARLLRSGGQLAVADVEKGTGTADFLNTFVHEHTPGGHEGIFLDKGEVTRSLTAAGFRSVYEQRCNVAWRFPDRETMVGFCRVLFAVRADDPAVCDALRHFVGINQSDQDCRLLWQLRYAVATI